MSQHQTQKIIPTALVVNDDVTQLNILTRLLRKEGIEAVAYESAEVALSAMDESNLPDLIVTDLYMPGIDGWRFCRLLRSSEYPGFNDVPILVVSATFADDDVSRINAVLGANAFLSSPVEGKRFISLARSLLAGERPRFQLRILIVEDSRTLADLFKKTFEQDGYYAEIAVTLNSAIDLFGREPFDMTLIDYHLPDGKGDNLLMRFKKIRPDVICIMMTKDPSPDLALAWMRKGAAAYLRKPFEPQYLLELCTRARRERSLLGVEDLLEARTQELRKSEDTLRRRLIYERCAAECIQCLATSGDLLKRLHRVLQVSRDAVEADRAYIFLHEDDPVTGPCMTQLCESCAKGIIPQIDNADLQHLAYEPVAPSLLSCLKAGLPFTGVVAEMTEPERKILEAQDILSILIVPIFNDDRLWGFIGFDDCTAARYWQKNDICILRTIADGIAAAVDRWKAFEDLKEKSREQRLLLDGLDTQVWYLSNPETYRRVNLAHADFLGHHPKDIAHKKLEEFMSQDLAEFYRAGNMEVFETGQPVYSEEWIPNANGERRLIKITRTPKLDEKGKIEFVICTGTDITEEKKAREEESHVLRLLEFAIAQMPFPVLIAEAPDGKITHFNQGAIGLLFKQPEDIRSIVLDDHRDFWQMFYPDGTPYSIDDLPLTQAIRYGKITKNAEIIIRRKEGDRWIMASAAPLRDEKGRIIAGIVVFPDITEQKQAEAEQQKLQAQLNQAQKMESVGRLAGGVAHDFNNMLGVILGHAEMALQNVGENQILQADLMEIKQASQRSADLTRQLLAFARKQTIEPQIFDLNHGVNSIMKMLHCLIGEDIELAWLPGQELWRVNVDPSQIDQILANLCINARDAIGEGGRVTIETANMVFDEVYCVKHPGSIPGEYALLAVSDDGCGMGKETQSKLFEPFFTTKEPGKGTGLGLATVYGIVKQNNGFINVYSELGYGTSVKIYLPRYAHKSTLMSEKDTVKLSVSGSETILLVEDEPAILRMTAMMLKLQGYTVLVSATPGKAISLAREHAGDIHLLITDVVMPEMNGRDLAKNLSSLYPDIKCLFMSGYTADIIAHHGMLDKGVHFINKPFSINGLATIVRDVLDGD